MKTNIVTFGSSAANGTETAPHLDCRSQAWPLLTGSPLTLDVSGLTAVGKAYNTEMLGQGAESLPSLRHSDSGD